MLLDKITEFNHLGYNVPYKQFTSETNKGLIKISDRRFFAAFLSIS